MRTHNVGKVIGCRERDARFGRPFRLVTVLLVDISESEEIDVTIGQEAPWPALGSTVTIRVTFDG